MEEGFGKGWSLRFSFIICDIFIALLLAVTCACPFLSGAGYGSWVAVFDLSRCTRYKIKASFGCTGFLALISENIFVFFACFSAGQDLETLMYRVPAFKL